ncbi:MAG TPA: patatin-like phospholipase family protein, partial [Bacteroidia bacterium]
LKALEENNIPIDYITGTSVGALVGALYASGYSIEEIEKILTSEKFISLTKGEIEKNYQYYYFRKEDDASWITLKVSFDSSLVTNIPTNLINSVPIDFELINYFSNSAATAAYNFDSLLIPFRCVASDIENQKTVVFKKGGLNEAVRASMTYPLFLKPIRVDGKILFDGGLYNNFPADVMIHDFNPDYLIGSVVTNANPKVDEENLYAQLRSMLVKNPDLGLQNKPGIIIKPWSDVGTFNFSSCKRLIDSGYAATIRQIDSIRKNVSVNRSKEEVIKRRNLFKSKFTKETIIDEIEVEGLNKNQQYYVKHLLGSSKTQFSLEDVKKGYFRLSEDNKIRSIFPSLVLNPQTGKYKLNLKVKREKDLFIQFGGNLSTRPISTGFVSLQFHHLSKVALSVYANGYFGRLNQSGLGKIRIDFPTKVPIYIEPTACISRWDYYSSSTLFYNFVQPAYLTQRDRFGDIKIGIPIGNKSKAMFGGGIAELDNVYFQKSTFAAKDTADKTIFSFNYANLEYEYNTLNRKLYASEGGYFDFKAKYINGNESYLPGDLAMNNIKRIDIPHQWAMVKAKFDGYLKPFRFFKVGILLEGVYSTQGLFSNYTSSVLSAPAFMPTPESKTLFLPNFRAYQYVAGGGKIIFHPIKKIDMRFEAYIFQPYQAINNNVTTFTASLGKPFLDRYIVGMAALVYHTALGPLSLSANYYHGELVPFTFLAHFGYTIFNRKSIE